MFLHLVKLLARALANFPTVLSGNWLSILLPLVLYGFIEGPKLRNGWPAMTIKSKWAFRRDSGILVAAYSLLFAWAIVKTVYQDHVDMVGSAARIQAAATSQYQQLSTDHQKLQIDCARTEGANDSLTKQNRDQQNSINNCQTEAIKRLVPDMENHDSYEVLGAGNDHLKSYIYTTNRSIPRTVIVLRCTRDVNDIDAFIMGNPYRFTPRYTVTGPHQYVFHTPGEWTPIAPIQINISFTGAPPDCTAQRTDR